MSTVEMSELRATCTDMMHAELCPGEKVCACPCHWQQHGPKVLSKGRLGVVVACACGWACWGSTARAASQSWSAHVAEVLS